MKEKFIINGLAGERKLEGEIEVKGSKNAILPVMASSVLFEDGVALENVPAIEDIFRMSELLEKVGAKVDFQDGKIKIDSKDIGSTDLDEEISKRMRASIFLSGPLLARFGKVSFPHPGGCVIGERPIDLFLEGFQKMGAKVEEKKDQYVLETNGKKLKGAEIFFPIQSVGATETFMMAGVLAEGKTVLKNSALEPEVVSLGEFLKHFGAKIHGLGTTTIEIEGGGILKSKGENYQAIPDRLEAGCFLILGALSAKDLLIRNCNPDHIQILIELMKGSGVEIEVGENSLRVRESKLAKSFKSFSIKTHEYPGFPTDLQAPVSILLTQTQGQAVVFETLFENRLNYTDDLIKMGANITIWDPHRMMIEGPTELKGRELESPDIRAGLALVLAGVVAKDRSVINNTYYIDRGYEKIEERLRKIGVDIKRTNN